MCLTCRFVLARCNTIHETYRRKHHDNQLRSFTYDSRPSSKERIEALISGSIADEEYAPGAKSKGRNRRNRRGNFQRKGSRSDDDDEPAEWELPPKPAAHAPPPQSCLEIPEIQETSEPCTEDLKSPSEDLPLDNKPQPLEPRPARPRRVFSHGLLRHQDLGVTVLGKPIEALIIKNPNKMRNLRKPLPILEEDTAVTGSPVHWGDNVPMDDDCSSDFSAEVQRNIEELRPKYSTVLRRKDFDKLMSALVDGFTGSQLIDYFSKGNSDSMLNAADTPSYSWLAVLIMTTMWKLEIQEQVEGLGTPNRVIESLRADFLDTSNNERISTNLDDFRIAMYTRKSTVPLILDRIDEAVRLISSKTISTKHISKDNLLSPVLEELERITNTVLEHQAKHSELSISWLADIGQSQATPGSNDASMCTIPTETPADIVLRLLLTRRQSKDEFSDVQILSPNNSDVNDGIFLEHHREKKAMSWRDKMRRWSRYVTPIYKESSADGKPLSLPSKALLRKSSGVTVGDQIPNHVTATFGHILHTEDDVRETKMAKNRRILFPVVPHPAALTSVTVSKNNAIVQSASIVLNFTPDPTPPLPHGQANLPPQIRLRLPVNPDNDLAAFSVPPDSTLEGIAPWQVKDILLPGETVDVRLTQHRFLPLNANQSSLKAFLAASEFNLLAGQLRTPSRTRFSIPSSWLPKGDQSTTEQTPEVPYLFTGLEVHQVVELAWHGHILRYSSIEAGQHAGQRRELSLHANLGDLHAIGQNKTFLQLVEEVALGKHFPWQDGHKLMQQCSGDEFTGAQIIDEPCYDETVSTREADAEVSSEEAGPLGVNSLDNSEAARRP
ncbi:hypothetical protein RJ55_06050 [Drechmeria coniospora]|nr:hypothetical protein RJ55_06050 [Drechmeria coniospora]